MISQTVHAVPPNPKHLILALALALLLRKEQLEALGPALMAAPMLAPYLRHLSSRR